ncbi:hypothetical protein FRB90_011766 [Tulasnella sp. 427]|nr:hypothetical protein FRB90_011766 [Tulasnella sp. 427]
MVDSDLENSLYSTYQLSRSVLRVNRAVDTSPKRLTVQHYLKTLLPASLFPSAPDTIESPFSLKVRLPAHDGAYLTLPRHPAMQSLIAEVCYLALTSQPHQNAFSVGSDEDWEESAHSLLEVPSHLQQGVFVQLRDVSQSFQGLSDTTFNLYQTSQVVATDTFSGNAQRTFSFAAFLSLDTDPLSAYFAQVQHPVPQIPQPWWLHLISDDIPEGPAMQPLVPGFHFSDHVYSHSTLQASHPSVYKQLSRSPSPFPELMVARTGTAFVFYFQPNKRDLADLRRVSSSPSAFHLQFDSPPPYLSSNDGQYAIEWDKFHPDPSFPTRGHWQVVKLAPGDGLFIPPGSIYSVFFEDAYTGHLHRFLHRTTIPRTAATSITLGDLRQDPSPDSHILARRLLSILLHPRGMPLTDSQKAAILTFLSHYTAWTADQNTPLAPLIHKHFPHPVTPHPLPAQQLWNM